MFHSDLTNSCIFINYSLYQLIFCFQTLILYLSFCVLDFCHLCYLLIQLLKFNRHFIDLKFHHPNELNSPHLIVFLNFGSLFYISTSFNLSYLTPVYSFLLHLMTHSSLTSDDYLFQKTHPTERIRYLQLNCYSPKPVSLIMKIMVLQLNLNLNFA